MNFKVYSIHCIPSLKCMHCDYNLFSDCHCGLIGVIARQSAVMARKQEQETSMT